MRTLRKSLFVLSLGVALGWSCQAASGAVFTETFEGYATGSWVDADGSAGWREYSSGSDGSIVATPVFAGDRAGQLAPSAVSPHVWNRFNTDSQVANDMVWVEFFIHNDFASGGGWTAIRIPTTNNIGAPRLQIGFDASNDVNANLFVSGAALVTKKSSISFVDGNWYHVVAEIDLNGASSTVMVYARQKAAGDTSPLTPADLLTLGGSTSNVFSWNGTQIDSMTIVAGPSDATSTYDNIAVYEENIIVPEPVTMLLLCVGSLIGRRRKV